MPVEYAKEKVAGAAEEAAGETRLEAKTRALHTLIDRLYISGSGFDACSKRYADVCASECRLVCCGQFERMKIFLLSEWPEDEEDIRSNPTWWCDGNDDEDDNELTSLTGATGIDGERK